MIDTLKQVFADLFMLDPASIGPGTSQDDVAQWDSLNHLLLITEVEARFGVLLSSDQIVSIRSVADLLGALEAQGVAA